MNILLVSNGFPPTAFGGVEIYTSDIANHLLKKGHKVTVFCRESDLSTPDYHISDETNEGIRIIRVVNDYKKIYSYRDTYIDEKIDRIFKRFLRQIAPDLIHFNHLIALSARLPMIAARSKIPSILSLHDFWALCHRVNLVDWKTQSCPGPQHGVDCSVCVVGSPRLKSISSSANWFVRLVKSVSTPKFRYRMRRMIPGAYKQPAPLFSSKEIFDDRHSLFQQTIQSTQKILSPSSYVREQFASNGYPLERIEILPLGINLMEETTQDFPMPVDKDSKIIFAAIGSIIPIKGFDTLIEAFKKVNNTNIRLVLFGREDIYPGYVNKLRDLSRGDARITFKGAFAPNERAAIYQSFDVLVVPSKVPESFSMVCREALLFGKPVIAARIGALPEIIIDNVNGFLFDPEDIPALSTILNKITGNISVLSKLHLPGPIPILTLEEHTDLIEKIYIEVL